MTVAYSYIGPELTYPIYREGTIGKAKAHLEETAKVLTQKLAELHGHAYVSVNKALVTQASAAIPVVPLYISLLYKIMKEQNLHEGCIEQITRLYNDSLYSGHQPAVDDKGLIRLDDWEMKPEVQSKVNALWNELNTANINSLTDLKGYRHEFHQLLALNHPMLIILRMSNPMCRSHRWKWSRFNPLLPFFLIPSPTCGRGLG